MSSSTCSLRAATTVTSRCRRRRTPAPTRHQYIELAPLLPHVTEFRRHEVCCSSCGHRTRAHYDDDVIPRYAFGPRVAAVASLLTGVYHLSRRSTVRLLQELLGLRISTGSVSNLERRMSKAVKPSVEEAWAEAQSAAVKHTDGTTWLEAGMILALWTIATAGVTVFKILSNGQGDTLETKLLTSTKGVLVSDRASALKFWAMHLRQICWAHLLRKFMSFTERDGPTRTLGRELLDCTRVIFAYWHDFKEGRLTREQLATRIAPVRTDFERTLRRANRHQHQGPERILFRHVGAPRGAVDLRRCRRRRAHEQPRRARAARLRALAQALLRGPE
jgi:transposase